MNRFKNILYVVTTTADPYDTDLADDPADDLLFGTPSIGAVFEEHPKGFAFEGQVSSAIKKESAGYSQAVTLAEEHQAKLTVIGIVNTLTHAKANKTTLSELMGGLIEHKRQQLKALVQSIENPGIEIDIKVLVGKGFIEIIREVIRHQHDLMIKSVNNSGDYEIRLFGSTDMKLLRMCPCPVWLINSSQQKGYKEIVAALDYDPEEPYDQDDSLNQKILDIAISQSLAEFSELHIVHAWKLDHEDFLRSPWLNNTNDQVDTMVSKGMAARQLWFKNSVKHACDRIGAKATAFLKPQLHLIKGDAKKIVPQLADDIGAELVVVGTVGRTGMAGFIMGNTAEAILNRIECSVLAIKPEGFLSPIKLTD
jgi:nucleotide-binding universal stress UspA family protein